MEKNFNISEFYKEIYSKIDNKKTGLKTRESSPCGSKKGTRLSVYVFGYAYLRMFYTNERTLDVNITVEKYGPNQKNIHLEFTEEELKDDKTKELIVCILKLISYSLLCPEYYCFESDFLSLIVDKSPEVRFPLSDEKRRGFTCYHRYFQALLWELEDVKNDLDMWIGFVNSEYFRVFEELCGMDTDRDNDCEKIVKILDSSSLPKEQVEYVKSWIANAENKTIL